MPTPTATPYGNNQSPSAGAAVRPSLNSLAAMLPTPDAYEGSRGGSQHPDKRKAGGHSPYLASVVEHVLPTIKATNNENRSSNWANGPNIGEALRSLPTPTTQPTTGNGHARNLGAEVQDWREYEPAIRRQEAAFGRPAPLPTEPGRTGKPRLSARFSEWLMGCPDGWITGVPGITRNEALKAAGNGVVPQQCAAAATRFVHDFTRLQERAA